MKIFFIKNILFNASVRLSVWLETRNGQGAIGIAVLFFLIFSISDANAQGFDGRKYGELCHRILQTVEGKFGSLLTATAGLGALVASATGGFKMAWSLLVVSIGAFTLRTYQEIWFQPCGGG